MNTYLINLLFLIHYRKFDTYSMMGGCGDHINLPWLKVVVFPSVDIIAVAGLEKKLPVTSLFTPSTHFKVDINVTIPAYFIIMHSHHKLLYFYFSALVDR